MFKKFLVGGFVLIVIFFIWRTSYAFWGFGRPGIYMREDASDDKNFITEVRPGQGVMSVSGRIVTLSLSSYDISDDPGNAYTLIVDNLTGRNIITNDGAGAARTYNLPDIPANIDTTTDTYVAYIYLEEDQTVDINPDTGDWIYDLTDATGDAIEATSDTSFIILIPHDSTGWWPHSKSGTWTDVD